MKCWFLTNLSRIPDCNSHLWEEGSRAGTVGCPPPPQTVFWECLQSGRWGMCKKKTLDPCNVPSNPALLLQGETHSAPSRSSLGTAASSLLPAPCFPFIQKPHSPKQHSLPTSNFLLHRRKDASGDPHTPTQHSLHVWNRSMDLVAMINQLPLRA